MNKKICEMISRKILESLDNGVVPWQKPWVGGPVYASNYLNRRAYSLLNQLMMEPGEYVTYKQAHDKGGQVKKGAKGSQVVFWTWLRYDEDGKLLKNDEVRDNERRIPYLRYYTVFNINDCEGLEPHCEEELPNGASMNLDAEKILSDYLTRENISFKRDSLSSRAFYRPSEDLITVPKLEQFVDTAEYYSTVFHECVHSTGHAKRLKRFDGTDSTIFESDSYSKEELVAEIGSAFLMNALGIETESSFKNSTAYIGGWRDKIAKDNQLIVTAAGKAEKACRYILNQEVAAS